MFSIRQTNAYSAWLNELKDERVRGKIVQRVIRLSMGNPGDVKPVGSGVSELRINFGPGYRVYYKQVGKLVIVLLCGGDKSSQAMDIKGAIALAEGLEKQE